MKRMVCLLLIVLLVACVAAPTVGALSGSEASGNTEEHPYIGRRAKFTVSYPYLWNDANINDQKIADANKLPAVVRIVDVYVYSKTVTLYKLEAADGSAWPEVYEGYYYVESTKVELLPEPSISATVTDANGNEQTVTVTGDALPDGAMLQINEAIANLDDGFAWDIHIKDVNGNIWQPVTGNAVTIKLPVSGIQDGEQIELIHFLEDEAAIRAAISAGNYWNEDWVISAYPAAADAYAEVTDQVGVAFELLTPTVHDGYVEVKVSSFSIYQWNGTSFVQTATGDTLKIVFHATLTQGNASGTYYVTRGQTIRCDRGGKTVFGRQWQTSADNSNFYYNTDHVRITQTDGNDMEDGSGANVEFTVDSNAPAGTTFWIRCRVDTNAAFWAHTWSDWVTVKFVVVDTWSINFYNGSSKISTDTLVTGSGTLHDPIAWPSNPSKSGYTFRGWSTVNTGTSVINTGTWYPVQESTNLYAVFTFDVTYNLNGGSGTSTTQTVNSNDNVTLHGAPSRTGYTFGGWVSSADGAVYSAGGTYTGKKATTMTAKWNPINYTYNVVYKSTTGASLGSTTVTKAFDTTNTITPPAINGYTAPVAQSVKWDSTTAKTITFTYTPVSYSITYNLGGGSVATANPGSYNVESNAFTLVNPTRVGYTFVGWTGTGLSGTVENVTIAKGSTGNRTYTAVWQPNIYKVTLDKNGGSGGTDCYWYLYQTKVEHGQPNVGDGGFAYYYTDANCTNYMINGTGPDRYYHVNIPSRNGYTFGGYWTGANGTGIQYVDASGMCINDIYENEANNPTLIAYWIPITYTITYHMEGGNAVNPETYTIESGTIMLMPPTKAGCVFKGWTGTGITGDPVATVVIPAGSVGDRVYYAVWEYGTVDLTIVANGVENGQSVIFTVTNLDSPQFVPIKVILTEENQFTVKIVGVPVGTYAVNELNEWSWRVDQPQNPDGQTGEYVIVLSQPQSVEFTFPQVSQDRWLTGCSYKKRRKGEI